MRGKDGALSEARRAEGLNSLLTLALGLARAEGAPDSGEGGVLVHGPAREGQGGGVTSGGEDRGAVRDAAVDEVLVVGVVCEGGQRGAGEAARVGGRWRPESSPACCSAAGDPRGEAGGGAQAPQRRRPRPWTGRRNHAGGGDGGQPCCGADGRSWRAAVGPAASRTSHAAGPRRRGLRGPGQRLLKDWAWKPKVDPRRRGARRGYKGEQGVPVVEEEWQARQFLTRHHQMQSNHQSDAADASGSRHFATPGRRRKLRRTEGRQRASCALWFSRVRRRRLRVPASGTRATRATITTRPGFDLQPPAIGGNRLASPRMAERALTMRTR